MSRCQTPPAYVVSNADAGSIKPLSYADMDKYYGANSGNNPGMKRKWEFAQDPATRSPVDGQITMVDGKPYSIGYYIGGSEMGGDNCGIITPYPYYTCAWEYKTGGTVWWYFDNHGNGSNIGSCIAAGTCCSFS